MECRTTLLLSAVLAVVLTLCATPVRAEGILVQPDVGALEPPSIADEDEQGDEDDGSGENVPAEIAPSPGVIEVVPAGPENRQGELERPGTRQTEMERGGGRQEDLEMPNGPGVKY